MARKKQLPKYQDTGEVSEPVTWRTQYGPGGNWQNKSGLPGNPEITKWHFETEEDYNEFLALQTAPRTASVNQEYKWYDEEEEEENRKAAYQGRGQIPRGENERGHGRFSQTMKPMRTISDIDRARIKRFGGEVLNSFKSAARFDQPKFKNGRRTKG